MLPYGIIESYVHHNNQVGVLIEISCESEASSKTPELKELARNLCMQLAAFPETKFGEDDFYSQIFIKSTLGETIRDIIEDLSRTLKEKIEVNKFCVYQKQNMNAPIV